MVGSSVVLMPSAYRLSTTVMAIEIVLTTVMKPTAPLSPVWRTSSYAHMEALTRLQSAFQDHSSATGRMTVKMVLTKKKPVVSDTNFFLIIRYNHEHDETQSSYVALHNK